MKNKKVIMIMSLVLMFVCFWGNTYVEAGNIKNSEISLKLDNSYHKKIIQEGNYNIDGKGHLFIQNKDELSEQYVEEIVRVNQLVDMGVGYFNESGEFVSFDSEDVERNVYNYDKQVKNNECNIELDATYPRLNAYSIALQNKNYISGTLQALAAVDPSTAYATTVAIWVAKVKEGGDWDYKNRNGYAPYYKKWNAYQKNISAIRTSEWFGNYNYGFTGKVLFSQEALLRGGDAVSYAKNRAKDTPDDKRAIVQGFYES
ncbi:MAG: hypothetical protein J6O60_08995 [Lachnospiraceae bacterium]|nr:hypothetical protein [Lachnospiraceae bacterium]